MIKGLLIFTFACCLASAGLADGASTGLAASIQDYSSDEAITQFQLNTGSFELDTNWSFEREGATSELTGASRPESLGLVFHPYGSSVLGYREEGEDTRTLQLSLPKQQFNLTRTLQGHGASITETWSSELALGSRTKLGFRGSPAASGSDVFTLTSRLGQGKSFDARWSNSAKIEKSFAYMQKSSRSSTGLTYSQLQGSQLLGAAYNHRTADGVLAVLAQRHVDLVAGQRAAKVTDIDPQLALHRRRAEVHHPDRETDAPRLGGRVGNQHNPLPVAGDRHDLDLLDLERAAASLPTDASQP